MSPDFTFRLLMGHLTGDYLFQNNWMALNKKKDFLAAIAHCYFYTICVGIFIYPELVRIAGKEKYVIIFLLFLSHYVIDAFALIDKWLHLIGGRSYANAEKYCKINTDLALQQYMRSYTSLVQTVADNTVHLLIMYVIIHLFGVAS